MKIFLVVASGIVGWPDVVLMTVVAASRVGLRRGSGHKTHNSQDERKIENGSEKVKILVSPMSNWWSELICPATCATPRQKWLW